MTFDSLLQEVRDHLLAALSHADFPMQQLAAALNRNERDDRNLFQTMFQYRNFWPELQPFGNATYQLQAHRRTSAGFPLVLDITKDAGSDALTLSLILEPDRFAKSAGERMLTRYRELLALFAKNPSSSVLPLAEHCEVPNNGQSYPLDKTVVEVFCQRFAKQPDALAVEGPDGSLTYAELHRRSISIAHRLVESGIQRGDVVGLCAGRSVETIAGIWGILRAGAAHLPLDARAPDKWKQSLVADAEAKLILSSPDGWFDTSLPGLSLGDIPHAEKLEPIDLSQPEGLAYIIYTSGSTGRPKGITMTHQALTTYAIAARDYMELSDADRVLQFASLGFDTSVEEIVPTLITGGTLVLRNDEMTESPARFEEFLDVNGISVINLPTGFRNGLVHSRDAFFEFPESLRCIWRFDADDYRNETVLQLAKACNRIEEGIVANPEVAVAPIGCVSIEQSRPSVTTGADDPSWLNLPELFQQQVQLKPDATAVVDDTLSLTFAELWTHASRLASMLREHGLQRGESVGVLLTRSSRLPVAMWGTWLAGGGFAALDPDYPAVRLDHMAREADLRLVITEEALADQAPVGIDTVILENIETTSSTLPDELIHLQADDLATIAFTSGSTGQPKAVAVNQGGLANLVAEFRRLNIMTEADTVCAHSTVTFDVGVRDILFPTALGAIIILANDVERVNPARLISLLQQHQVTYLNATPSLWRLLMSEWPEGLRLKAVSSGEALTRDLAELLLERAASQLWNVYGPAETSMLATSKFVASADDVTIGRPWANCEALVVNAALLPQPLGLPGELLIGGICLARGYLNQKELNAEKFVTLDTVDGPRRFYRTGDRACWLPDGDLEYLGRVDRQIKCNGIRIEPAEIETCLRELPSISDAVITKWARDGGDSLAAYLVAAEEPSLATVRDHIKSRLPSHLWPQHWAFLPKLPLTPSGKVDVAALPSPEAPEKRKFEPPHGPIETKLATIWSDLLNVEQVGRGDNFFALGGNSLMVMQVFARIEKTFHSRPSIVQFLDNPVLSHLAAGLEDSGESESLPPPEHTPTPEKSGTQEDNVEQVYPASLQQRYFHDLDVLSGRDHSIIARLPIRCCGPFDIEAFRHAIERIVERHDIYRTVYRQTENDLEAVVLNRLEPIFDIQNGVKKSEREHVQEMLQLSEKLWNLETDSPLHVSIRRVSDSEHLCILSFHHIACDGGSWRLFTSELDELLNTGSSPISLEDIPEEEQFSSYAKRQRDHNKAVDANMDYWMAKLRDLPPPSLPPADPPDSSTDTNILFEVLPNNLWERAQETASSWRTTPHNLMMAAFHAWHFRYLGGIDTTIGTPINARLLSGDDRIHGCTVYMLPIRQQMTAEMSFFELQQSVQTSMLEAMEHAEVNLLDLQAALAERDHRDDPIYAAIFQVRNLNTDVPSLFSGAKTELLRLPTTLMQVPLLLQVHLDQSKAAVSLCFDSERTSPSAAKRILNAFHILLQNLLKNPKAPLASQPLIDDQDRALVLDRWARNPHDYPREESVPDLFDETAREFPNRTVLVSGDQKLNYHQLNQRSKQLAAEFRKRGIGRNQRVGICMERSADLIIALIAILRTGASYLPLDPEYPVNRLRFMVEDAEAAVVLTHQPCFARLRTIGRKLWLIEDLRNGDGGTSQDPFPEVASLDPAYLMYTSGTTGKPKGSLIPHRGIVRLVRGADYARFGPEETYLFLASPSFDAATFEIWAPLLNGGKLVVMPPGTPSLSDIGEIIRTQGVTTLWLTARLFDAIVDEAPEILKPLRQLLTGGDTLSPRHVARCRKTHPDLILINGYGPTENTTFSCCFEIPAKVSSETPIPIGKPIANSEALILDAHQQPVPPGSMGELYLGGDGLSLGYWKRDELNAQAFVPHPFSADPQDRLYRTGDLARYLPDGQIEFVGRIDHQVKIRGYRVELSEIETVLGGCPVIERCSVLAMDEKHGKSLAAALVPVDSTGAEEALTEAKAYLNENLPRHLQPDRWMVLTSLPLTPNGKLDRKALAQDFAKSESHERPIIPPNSPLEEQLLEIWRRLFQSNRISTDDSFFSLGGTSLTAMRLTWEVERELGRQLPISDLFRNPTIQSIGRFLSDGGEKSKSTVVDLREGKSDRNGLFIVHGWGGEVFAQAKFIKGIPADFPVYGVQAVELSGEDERLTSFEEMAKRYAKDIVARQPDGPYDLCGFSLGGMIAYETARELHRQGKEIGRLMVFDTHPKNLPFFQTLRAQSGPLVKRLAHHVGGICSGKKSLSWGYLKGRFNAMRQRLGSKNSQGESLPGIEVPADSDYYSILNDRFVPEPFPVPTTVFRAIGSSSNLVVEWQYLTKNNVTFVDVSSSHLEMFEDAELSKRVGNLLGADLT